MKGKNFRTGLAAAAGMLVLILDSRTAIDSIRDGIDLCLTTLIPSLFPFLVLSALMTGSLIGSDLKSLRPIGKLCGIPAGGESLLLAGFLGGYPVGAQNVALAYEQGAVSRSDAERILAFCSNAGPAFLFGIVGHCFDASWAAWLLWAVHIIAALCVGAFTRQHVASVSVIEQKDRLTMQQAVTKSLAVMAQVCGWVVLFRMLIGYLERWFFWILPAPVKVVLSGLLELSNGCVQLRKLESDGMRFLAASALLSLGGLCVTLQTSSVTGNLSLRTYFPGKLLQASLSTVMSVCLQFCFPAPQRAAHSGVIFASGCLVSLIAIYFLRKNQKNSSIPLPVGV